MRNFPMQATASAIIIDKLTVKFTPPGEMWLNLAVSMRNLQAVPSWSLREYAVANSLRGQRDIRRKLGAYSLPLVSRHPL